MNKRKKPELLAPAGSPEILKTAIRYGADAVYIGSASLSLRKGAKNAGIRELADCVSYAHERGKRVYVAVNVFAHNTDIEEARAYLKELDSASPDALIISDPGILMLAKELIPSADIHISTQANCTNYESFRFYHMLGAKRVVAARELSLAELREIREKLPDGPEIECFVHGSMCISYSGRCLLSAYMTGRSANSGACTHPCRWQYALVEEKRPGQYFPVEEDGRGTYIMNSKDLNMIGHVPELMEAGIDSFKIEGRMKTALYVASVTRAYRRAIDACFEDPAGYEALLPELEEEVQKCTVRDFTTGFYFGRPDENALILSGATYERNYIYLGTAGETRPDGMFALTQKNKFAVGDRIEIMRPDGEDRSASVLRIENAEGYAMENCPHAGEALFIRLSEQVSPGDVLRMKG
ncbi:MAG: U32 family peptidase [Lachnospiraceae bacterium]|nr:U32 family peptidase [Lachnospiraceae bacterium]